MTLGVDHIRHHPLDPLGLRTQALRRALELPVMALLEEDELHAPRADERVDEGPGRVPIDLARVELPVLGRACHDRETDVGIASALVRRVPSQLATAFSADRSHAEETAIAGGAAELGQTA